MPSIMGRLSTAGILSILSLSAAFAGVPNLSTNAPADPFIGEQFCFDADFTNTGAVDGFGPYLQIVIGEDFTLDSASFLGVTGTLINAGTFAGSDITDPIGLIDVSGPVGADLIVVRYPVGSVTTGQPELPMSLCVTVDADQSIVDINQATAISIVPAYEFGDTATGINGAEFGAAAVSSITPKIIRYQQIDMTAEGERPPGPDWAWDIDICADIAANETFGPITYADVEPITLPGNIQFQGPFVLPPSCTASTTPADLTLAPGGTIDLNCTTGTGGGAGPMSYASQDICVTFPVYFTDTLDETNCATQAGINTAKHLTVQKSSSGATIPGGTRSYSFDIDVSEFVAGVTSLTATDVMPDGLTFNSDAMISLNGALPSMIAPSVSNNTPGVGQTTVAYDVFAAVGALTGSDTVTITYTADIDQTFDATVQPIRSRDTLTNNVEIEYDLAGGASSCMEVSADTVTIDDVALVKTLVSPLGGEADVDEPVVFRLNLAIPSGDSQNIIFRDYLPKPVFSLVGFDTNTNIAANVNLSYGPNDTLGLTPTSITTSPGLNQITINWGDVSTTMPQEIEVDLTLTVSDEPFADELFLTNIVQGESNNTIIDGATDITAASLTVRSPDVSIGKSVIGSSTGYETGDSVDYLITIGNSSPAEAFDVTVFEDVPAGLTACSLGTVTGGTGAGDIFAGGFTFATFTASGNQQLLQGETATLEINCSIAAGTTARTNITNTASVRWRASATGTPFTVLATAEVVTTNGLGAPAKSILSTSEAHTAEGSPRDLAQGEVIRFRLQAPIRAVTYSNFFIRDQIPNGLQFLNDGTATIAFVSDGAAAVSATGFSQLDCVAGTLEQLGAVGTITPDCQIPAFAGPFISGTDMNLSLGDLTNTENDAGDEYVVVELNAVATGSVANGAAMNNRLRVTSTEHSRNSGFVNTRLVDPIVQMTKTVSPTTVEASDTVTYTLRVEHTGASLADAFEISITDVLDGTALETYNFISGPIAPATETCTAAGAVVTDADPFGAGITITFDALPLGEVCEIQYSAVTRTTVTPGLQIMNTADVDSDSLPVLGTDPNTTGSPPGTQGTFNDDDDATVTIEAVVASKVIESTDLAHTSESGVGTVGDPRLVSIGETVRYRLETVVPESTVPNLDFTDLLPDGLEYVAGSARIAFVAEGAGINAVPAIACGSGTLSVVGDETTVSSIDPDCTFTPSGGPFTSGTDIIFDFGDVNNLDMDADDEFIIVEFDALVLNELSNQQSATLTNAFEVNYDGSLQATSSAAVAVVVEPRLTSLVTPAPVPVDNLSDPNATVSFTAFVGNGGGATAFQVGDDAGGGWQIEMPVGIENITNVAVSTFGSVLPNGGGTPISPSDFVVSGGDNNILTLTPLLQIDSAAVIVVTFDANVQATVDPGVVLNGSAEVVYAGQVAAGVSVRDDSDIVAGTGNLPIGDMTNLNDYRTEAAFSITMITEDPEIGLAKVLSSGPTNNNDGSYSLSYTFRIENTGNTELELVTLIDDLDAVFLGMPVVVDNVVVSSDNDTLIEQALYSGIAPNTNMLDPASTLPAGDSGSVVLQITVTPGNNLGPYDNTATTTSQSARTGDPASDTSDDGTAVDSGDGDPTNDSDVTPVSFTENPSIGLAKTIISGPTNNGDGSYTLTYRLEVANTGDVPLNGIQITDSLDDAFAPATYSVDSLSSTDFTVNPGFNGDGDEDILLGSDSLDFAASGQILVTVSVTPGANLGPYNNTAEVSATAPGGTNTMDTSDSGTNPTGTNPGEPGDTGGPDDPTPVTFAEAPSIGVAKSVVSGPTSNGSGDYTLSYRIFVENTGDVDLSSLQLVEELSATFPGVTSFTVDALTSPTLTVNAVGFDGVAGSGDTDLLTGADSLAQGASAQVDLTITVTPGAALGTFNNSVQASGDSPANVTVNDDSDSGTDPNGTNPGQPGDSGGSDDATPVTLAEAPSVAAAKTIIAGPTANNDGSFDLTYRVAVENTGDVALANLQIVEALSATFATATSFSVNGVTSPTLTVNVGFDGIVGTGDTDLLDGSDTLAAAATAQVDVDITVTPGATLGPYNNTATVDGDSPGGTNVSDDSDSGTDPNGTNPGEPGDSGGMDDPTPVTFTEAPAIGVAKTIINGPDNNGDGTYSLTYRIFVENLGDGPLNSVQVTDNIKTTFATSTTFVIDNVTSPELTVNFPGYDGNGDTNLLAGTDSLVFGSSASIDLEVTVTPGAGLGPHLNTAVAQGTSPGGTLDADNSDSGSSPSGTNPGQPGDSGGSDDPTPVTFTESPSVVMAKYISSGPDSNGDGTYDLVYTLVVENNGDVVVDNLQVTDNLATTFAGASFVINAVNSADFSVLGTYNGNVIDTLLDATDTLNAGAQGTITIDVTVTPGATLGPYDNTAQVTADSPANNPVTDDSDSGTDPSGTNPGQPGDTGGSDDDTPVTFTETPAIGVAKTILLGPDNNMDGTYSMTYRLTLQNTGDVLLNTVQVVDDLDATFGAPASYVVDNVNTSAGLTVNFPGFDGSADQDLLDGTDSLNAAQTETIDIELTVTPSTNLGPYNNTAQASGTSPATTPVTDDSDSGTDPDGTNGGQPGDTGGPDDPTPVTFVEGPAIATTKTVQAAPTNNMDGSYTFTYVIQIENTGDVPINNVQLTDDLADVFSEATSFTVDNVTSPDGLTVNFPGFDGDADQNLLDGTDSLPPGGIDSGSVELTLTVTPGAELGPYDNVADGSATSTGGANLTDDGTAPTVTFTEAPEIGLAKNLSAGPTNNNDGTYTFSYDFLIENTGNVDLTAVQLEDDLFALYGTDFVIDSLTSADFAVNGSYNGINVTEMLTGADSLDFGDSGNVVLTITITPGTNLGPYNNVAFVEGTSPADSDVTDQSTDGVDTDPNGINGPGDDSDPTPVTFSENAEIGVAKAVTAGPVNNADGTYSLTYTMTVENSGDVPIDDLQVTENLGATFAGATFSIDSLTSPDFTVSGLFNGAGNQNLLLGTDTLAFAQTGTIVLAITVTPGANLGPYDNAVTASGNSPADDPVSDLSTDGLVPDANGVNGPGDDNDITPVTFTETAVVGISSVISSGPANNGDGSYTLTYSIVVENFGDVDLASLQITNDLDATFGAADSFVIDSISSADFPINPSYNGVGVTQLLTGADSLAVGDTGAINLVITVTPGANLGPYSNSIGVVGTAPTGATPTDVSNNTVDPDPNANDDPTEAAENNPTVVSFTETPEIGLAKRVTAGPTNNVDGTYSVGYEFLVENSGDVELRNLQIVDDLATVFSGVTSIVIDDLDSPTLAVNDASYDGDTDTNLLVGTQTLAAGESGVVSLDITVTPTGAFGPFDNTATVNSVSPSTALISDVSADGAIPDANGINGPGDDSDPTPVSFSETALIGVSKTITDGPNNNADGTYSLTYTLNVESFSDVQLTALQVNEPLATTFASAVAYNVDSVSSSEFTVNASFDGAATPGLLDASDVILPGETGSITLVVTVEPGATLSGYNNTATISGTAPSNTVVTDDSNNSVDPDPNANDDPTDAGEDTPTPVGFTETPEIGLAKEVVAGPINNADGSYTLTYRFVAENSGDVIVDAVQITEDLASVFAGTTGFSIDALTSSEFSVNPGFDGDATQTMLLGSDTLAAGSSGSVDLAITVDAGNVFGPFNNNATFTADSPADQALSDESTDGDTPDANGINGPGDDNDPTVVSFSEAPLIGIAKVVSVGPINNADGTHTVGFNFAIENFGDVNLTNVAFEDDLLAVFGPSANIVIDSLFSSTLVVNPAYDGVGNNQILDAGNSVDVAARHDVALQVTVTPGANLGPFENSVTITADSPSGLQVTDDSVDSTDPDDNGNDDPTDDTLPTGFAFAETPRLGVAKSASAPATPNFDGSFTTAISIFAENSGDVVLNNVQIYDAVAANIAPATIVAIDNLTISGDLADLNPAYNGDDVTTLLTGAEALEIGESVTITFDLTFNPQDNLGPFENTAQAEAESPANPTPGTPNVTDDSVDGADPDANGNDDPGDDDSPTPVTFVPGVDATLDITDESTPGEVVVVTLTDADLDVDPFALDVVTVTVINDVTGESETVVLEETDIASGIFTIEIATVFGIEAGTDDDGEFNTQLDDTLTVTYVDQLNSTGGTTDLSDTGIVVGVASLAGNVWVDADLDDVFDVNEEPLAGWFLDLFDANDNLVQTVVANADGSYLMENIVPGDGYSVVLRHPTSAATFGLIEDISLRSEQVLLEQNLAIDPAGVMYDAITREPIEGSTLIVTNESGTPYPDACFFPGQQNQVLGVDGFYQFDVVPGGAAQCPASGGTFCISFTQPDGYEDRFSELIPPQPGNFDPTGLANPFSVGVSVNVPQGNDDTTYYTCFDLAPGDPNVVNNHVPYDPVGVDEGSVRLVKEVDRRSTSIGELVGYSITLENISPVDMPFMEVEDRLPPGFSYVEGSARLDGETTGFTVSGTSVLTFAGIELDSEQIRQLSYALRVGVGVTQGDYKNTAAPFVAGVPIGNSDSATVEVTADPDFEQTTIIGKVFHDRDEDGWQDSSLATGVMLKADIDEAFYVAGSTTVAYGDQPAMSVEDRSSPLVRGIKIGELTGRRYQTDPAPEIVISQLIAQSKLSAEIALTTKEGTRLVLKPDGEVEANHWHDKANSRTSQDLELSYRLTPDGANHRLDIIIRNNGLDERGIPAVRLATVEGLLIETDEHGRYHIAGVDAGFFERGRNFIVKVDDVTLPDGATLTTENPRVQRLTLGLMNQFDFGVKLPLQEEAEGMFEVKLAEVFFKPGSTEVQSEYMPLLNELALRIKSHGGGKITIIVPSDSATSLSRQRAQKLYQLMRNRLGADFMDRIEIVVQPSDVVDAELAALATPALSEPSKTAKLLLPALWVLNALVPAAYGDEVTAMTLENSAAVAQISTPSAGAPLTTNKDRIDIAGRYSMKVPTGGEIYATEDPLLTEPHLAVTADSQLPVAGGRLLVAPTFVGYTNYAAFIERLELRIYKGSDRVNKKPIVTLAPTQSLSATSQLVEFASPSNLGSAWQVDDEIEYVLRAYDANGYFDETTPRRLRLVDEATYRLLQDQLAKQNADASKRKRSAVADIEAVSEQSTPLNGNVLVLKPTDVETVKRNFTVSPKFAQLSAELTDEDRRELDIVIDELSSLDNFSVVVKGHTSSLRISKRGQKIFADNYVLSRARARSVAAYLGQRLSVPLSRMQIMGVGPDEPIADNSSAEGRAANRRVELEVSGNISKGRAVNLTLADPLRQQAVSAERGIRAAEMKLSGQAGVAVEGAAAGSSAHSTRLASVTAQAELLRQVYGRNHLALQNIPIRGSKVRLYGYDIDDNFSVSVNNIDVPVDFEQKFAVEYLLPIGEHTLNVALIEQSGQVFMRDVPLTVTGQHIFFVGLSQITLSENDITGNIEVLSGDERYQEDFLSEGRLAFYLKGKIKGKYLMTAQLDTEEEQLKNLLGNLDEKDRSTLFRRLDPDRYYPVYGDDSTVIDDTDSLGRMYVRLEWDKSHVMWGNFNNTFTGTEFSQYNRSLYGAQWVQQGLAQTEQGESKSQLQIFIADQETAFGHSEFLGTGGSLYYLKHRELLPGSEKLVVEVRDPDTGRVINVIRLQREVDYEIDEIQGRVILARPLLQITQNAAPSIIKDSPVDGYEYYLLADYEYISDGLSSDNLTLGARGKQWFGDHVAIGGTYVSEERDAEDYLLAGVDLTLQAGVGTYLKVEAAQTEATQAERQLSDNGGIDFSIGNQAASAVPNRGGDAVGVEARVDFAERGWSQREVVASSWWRRTDDQFSIARRDDGVDRYEQGAELLMELSESLDLAARYSMFEREGQGKEDRLGLQSDWQFTETATLSAELQQLDLEASASSISATLGALQYSQKFSDRFLAYVSGQFTLDNDDGAYNNNDLMTVGTEYQVGTRTKLFGEVSSGHRGDGGSFTVDHQLNPAHAIYATIAHSVDSNGGFGGSDSRSVTRPGSSLALGHRSSLSDQLKIYTEGQFTHDDGYAGLGHLFGLDWASPNGWGLSFSIQDTVVDGGSDVTERNSYSLGLNRTTQRLRASTVYEFRKDEGLNALEQTVSTSRLDFAMNESLRFLSKLNLADTDDASYPTRDAEFVEGSVGMAYRPVQGNRWNWLTKYTYLYDLPGFDQFRTTTDQRSNVFSVETIKRINHRWSAGGKYALKKGELRAARNDGDWFASTTHFGALTARYHVTHNWDAQASWRYLELDETSSKRTGVLLSGYRHLGNNFKLGVGYNFAEFSDDVTDLDYDHKGWFIDAVGKW